MRTVAYRRLIDDRNAVRISFELERDRVLRFVVQLECRFNSDWLAVVRYDTAHGFAHRDLLHPSGKAEKKELSAQDYNQALTFAIRDIDLNWENYRQRFKQWLEQEQTRE